MNKIQINKSRMYGASDLVLDNHSTLITQFVELVTAQQKLKDGMLLIGQNRQVQETDTSGLTTNKTQLREKVINGILPFSAALMAYATSINDVTLKTKANYTVSELKTVADPVLYDIGVLLVGLANPIRTNLTKYFVGDAEFTVMDSLLTTFKSAISKRRVAISESKVSTGNIGDVFKSLDKLLKDEIDALMRPFQFTQPDFYNAYKNARIIVNYSGRGKDKPDETTPPANSPDAEK
jgi:hypothetical protein